MKMGSRNALPLAAVVCAALSAGGCQGRADVEKKEAVALRALFAGRAPEWAHGDPKAWSQAKSAYEARGYKPIWIEAGAPRPEVEALAAAIARAPEDGLDPAHYDLARVKALNLEPSGIFRKGSSPEQVAEAEARLSFAFVALARDLQAGRVEPGKVDKHWFGAAREVDFTKALPATVEKGGIQETLSGLVPRHPQYVALKQALARYREIAANGGWPAVPAGVGESGPGVATLVQRLAATGDLAAPAGASPVFDASVREGLKRFEARHGLPADGRLDKEALAALNVPVADRIRQLELNLERWRWLPEQLGDTHVLVNIPTFHLTAFEGGKPALEMRVVTGKKDSPTPIFSDEMQTVVFSPYWNVPAEIAKEETIPAMERDPSYLARNNLEMVRTAGGAVRFRQRPGPGNALGHVKFLFPNNFDVYLHDTPADSLFGRVERDASHGCVRVEKPFELARWVLRQKPEWTPERIKAAMYSGVEKHVALEEKIPVYLVYETAWVEADGRVRFAEDVYGHDAAQVRLLPTSAPPATARVASAR
jgi:murein L,D-transpeptidase YcbB/YkuD